MTTRHRKESFAFHVMGTIVDRLAEMHFKQFLCDLHLQFGDEQWDFFVHRSHPRAVEFFCTVEERETLSTWLLSRTEVARVDITPLESCTSLDEEVLKEPTLQTQAAMLREAIAGLSRREVFRYKNCCWIARYPALRATDMVVFGIGDTRRGAVRDLNVSLTKSLRRGDGLLEVAT